jgi:hypothetical protein
MIVLSKGLLIPSMECTKCHKILDIEQFSYKNEKQKIFYLHCDKCRQKLLNNQPNKQKQEKMQYELVKKTNLITCPICTRQYISFRTFHALRHNNTRAHLKYVAKNN